MFIGRQRELSSLDKLYNSNKFEFVVIYGRRRVGKTALLTRFIDGKAAIYFMGVESNEKQNLENFSQSIMEFADSHMQGLDFPSFSSFQSALEYVFNLSENRRIVLAIDEYPYVAHSSKSLASTLQLLIDKYHKSSKLMLILCGSSMSYMEDQVLSYKAPLYGRRTAQMKILPFDFFESCEYLKKFSRSDKALIYGIVGGTPQYLLQIDDKLSVAENIKELFLNPVSFLYEEPLNLLKQEVREPSVYTAVISAIAGGASKMSEISSKANESTSFCANYLRNLIDLGMVEKQIPYREKASKKSIYTISDNMFRFWYRFVFPNISIISRGAVDLAYKNIEPHLSDYMGKVFEEICAQYLWRQLLVGKCSATFTSLGRWWGNNPSQKCQEEIDIMGEQDSDTALFCECKWTNSKLDQGVLETLIKRSELFSYNTKHYYLFAKSGFTTSCKKSATKLENIYLVGYDDICRELG